MSIDWTNPSPGGDNGVWGTELVNILNQIKTTLQAHDTAISNLNGMIGQPDGLATLDSGGDVPAAELDNVSVSFSSVSGTANLGQMAPGGVFFVEWNGSAWTDSGGNVITSRPTSRTDLKMVALLGTTQPSFMLAGDWWLKDESGS